MDIRHQRIAAYEFVKRIIHRRMQADALPLLEGARITESSEIRHEG